MLLMLTHNIQTPDSYPPLPQRLRRQRWPYTYTYTWTWTYTSVSPLTSLSCGQFHPILWVIAGFGAVERWFRATIVSAPARWRFWTAPEGGRRACRGRFYVVFSGRTDPANRRLARPGSPARRFRHVIDPTGLAGDLWGHFNTAALASSPRKRLSGPPETTSV